MKKISMLNPLIAVFCGFVIFCACSKGEIQISDDPDTVITDESTADISFDDDSSNTDGTSENEADAETKTAQADETEASETAPAMAGQQPNDITLTAQGLLGIPFVAGGQSPDVGFDSSGFIYYVLKENGYVNVSRAAGEQAAMGMLIDSPANLESGDLVFFSDDGVRAQFGGIYIGDGIMISCSMPGDVVKETDITTDYYLGCFFTGVRVL